MARIDDRPNLGQQHVMSTERTSLPVPTNCHRMVVADNKMEFHFAGVDSQRMQAVRGRPGTVATPSPLGTNVVLAGLLVLLFAWLN
jgi:hypothetical protein